MSNNMGEYEWLVTMQAQVGEWSAENFGTKQPPEFPLIGAGEEIGELTTSVLKRAQGIDDSEKYADRIGPEAEKDAIGDVLIYLLDTLARVDGDVSVGTGIERAQQIHDDIDDIETAVDAVRVLYGQYGRLCSLNFSSESNSMIEYRTGEVAAILYRLCEVRGYDFAACVQTAWDEVSDREWDADVDEHGDGCE
jgi:hypothetical protein